MTGEPYIVSVDGQLDMPFETLESAENFSEYMQSEGFECLIFELPAPPAAQGYEK